MTTTVLVRDATVKTLAISVQTLRLGPKQVTQAVFKQLIEEPLLDTKYHFRGPVTRAARVSPGGRGAVIPSRSSW